MTRVGIVAGILIILIASVFFGFRKAARKAEEEQAAAKRAATGNRIDAPFDVRNWLPDQ